MGCETITKIYKKRKAKIKHMTCQTILNIGCSFHKIKHKFPEDFQFMQMLEAYSLQISLLEHMYMNSHAFFKNSSSFPLF
jgi:hypothetical protein